MIHILSWKYDIGTDDFLDKVGGIDWENQKEISRELNINLKTLSRMISRLKEENKLVVYRYKDNNFIWCIGEDAKNLQNGYEALATARYRGYLDIGGNERDFIDTSAEEQENMLQDIAIFTSEKKEAAEDAGYEYFADTNHLRKAKGVDVSLDFHKEVEKMWI